MNYYNEFDPKAAAWLRALITAGLIPPGDVDTRSITEIKPHELTRYTQCHFFAGIGGWSLALQLAGWDPTRPVWTGSCPCQPFSSAGKQLAQADARHLWPVFFNLIRECRPECVFGEQVASAIGKGWLDGVSSDLEGAGYACGAAVLGAHSVGAPHIRQRLFWVADAAGGQRKQSLRTQGDELQRPADDGTNGGLADAASPSGPKQRNEPGRGARRSPSSPDAAEHPGLDGRLGDAHGAGPQPGHAAASIDGHGRAIVTDGSDCRSVLPVCTRLEGHAGHGDDGNQPGRLNPDAPRPVATASCARGGLPDAGSDMGGSGQHEPERGQEGRAFDRGLDAWSRFDLIPCADGKSRRIEPGLAPLAHGIPRGVVPSGDPRREGYAQNTAEARVTRLRGYGNGIVPQVAAEFIAAFTDTAP